MKMSMIHKNMFWTPQNSSMEISEKNFLVFYDWKLALFVLKNSDLMVNLKTKNQSKKFYNKVTGSRW